jgi:UDP-glucose 4-epimerase
MERVLVTGGAGFIGHRVVRRIREDLGLPVAVVDNLASGLAMPEFIDPEHRYAIDIRNKQGLFEAFDSFRPSIVVHLAAIHHIPTCEMERAEALDVNVVGTELVLKAAEEFDARRFVLASSGAVYDWVEGSLDETSTPLLARDNYALSKLTNEQQVRFWKQRTSREIRIARIFNTIGYDDPNAHLIPDILSQLDPKLPGQRVRLGNTGSRRDYIHAEDTARAIFLLATSPTAMEEEVLNIGTGKSISVTDLVEMIGTALGSHIEIEIDPSRMRPVDRPDQLGSSKLLHKHFGFEPAYGVQEAVTDIVDRWLGGKRGNSR